MCKMEADMKAQIAKVIGKILSDGQLIYSKVSKLETIDPIEGPEILEKLEKIRDVIEELSQMELEDSKPDAGVPKIVSVFSVSPSNLYFTPPIEPSSSCIDRENFLFEYNELQGLSELDTLFDHLEIEEFSDICSSESEYSDHESLQEHFGSIRDICDYDSDTGICEY